MVLWYGAGPSCSLQSLQVRTCLPGEGGVGKVPKLGPVELGVQGLQVHLKILADTIEAIPFH